MFRRAFCTAASLVLALSLSAVLLSGLINLCGTSAGTMTLMMRSCAPSESTGLPDSEYDGMVLMITRYLAGSLDEFQYVIDDGTGRGLYVFHDYEQEHMADCQSLFILCRTVLLISVMIATLLCIPLTLLRERRSIAAGLLAGSGMMLFAAAALGIWALIDFSGLFVLFHRISFSNRLWLLNPGTDMLIRLMPLGFFVRYAAIIACGWALGMLLLFVFSLRKLFRDSKKRRTE